MQKESNVERKKHLFQIQKRSVWVISISYCASDMLGLRSLLITSDSILLHKAAYGLRSTACCRANSLPREAAFSKSARASSVWHPNLRRRPLCTSAWQPVRPPPPLRTMALSRSCKAPGRRQNKHDAQFLEVRFVVFLPRCTSFDFMPWGLFEIVFEEKDVQALLLKCTSSFM